MTEQLRQKKDQQILAAWKPFYRNAILITAKHFYSDPCRILTESDLKCWLFYFLQLQKPYIPFAAHTEVTHIHEVPKGREKKESYSMRDLSLLCPWEVEENEKFIKQLEEGRELHSKGFSHRATAVHFEIKFVRQTKGPGIVVEDIEKFNDYNSGEKNIRDFVVVWGSKRANGLAELVEKLNENYSKITNPDILPRITFYLFDDKDCKIFKLNVGQPPSQI